LFVFGSFIIMIIYLLIFGFIVYFLTSVLQFMRRKNDNDRLLIQKIDELTQKIDDLKNN